MATIKFAPAVSCQEAAVLFPVDEEGNELPPDEKVYATLESMAPGVKFEVEVDALDDFGGIFEIDGKEVTVACTARSADLIIKFPMVL